MASFATAKSIVKRNAKLYPEKIAYVDRFNGVRRTFKQLGERINQLGNALVNMGCSLGDRIGYIAMNDYVCIELMLGIPCNRMIYVPLNFRLAGPELVRIINDSEIKVLLVSEEFQSTIMSIAPELNTVTNYIFTVGDQSKVPEGWQQYEDLLAKSSCQDPGMGEPDEDETAVIQYTSGTTGIPKGVMQTHRNYYACARAQVITTDFRFHDIGVIVTPCYHSFATVPIYAYYWRGCTIVILKKWDIVEFCRAIEEERISAGKIVTPMLNEYLQYPDKDKFDLSSLKKIGFAGGPMPPAIWVKCVEEFGKIFSTALGLTETTGTVTALTREELENVEPGSKLYRSVGKEVFGMEVRVINGAGEDVAPGEVGEIITRGEHVMKGYWKNPEETAKVLRDGWIYTGDAATIDEEGYIYIVDRLKDMIITGGENVYPAEVEAALYEHPAIKEAAVIGVPDPRWIEAVKAVVCLKEGYEATAEEIIQFCKGKIARYKVPKSVDFIKELPRNPSGKILKFELRNYYSKNA
ncbi:long-chain-fatty-acid--CoA ligase [Desulfoscipio gibsoniae]|uniref:Acyl-CoA synthetase (AMP-forming)/AMP-acid ligase II n=1 Tax=Desulfoscipio gibsoniae DSM 7213 TaxID=767817 RepID=R4KA81_9FIRM|nr:long-chain-fatty-acid--CoA ligase [Desulfoscipio gibsoniae]AGL00073.1 acyl-CoA synthetase (AMP-forming)/AMP-acid ligase II [Desulfoscipio gibsoniae DSM 7213]